MSVLFKGVLFKSVLYKGVLFKGALFKGALFKGSLFKFSLVVDKHVVKSVAKLVGNLLDLELLPDDLVLNVVNPTV
jgi:hypothetical protein